MQHLLKEAFVDVRRRVTETPTLSLFLDFDGTLTPIVEDYSEARLSPRVRRALVDITGPGNIAVSIVSGRALEDLQSRVGIDGIVYAGNHGLEIFGRGLQFNEPVSATSTGDLRVLCNKLSRALRRIRGAMVEYKRLSITVHFRRVADRDLPAMRTIIAATVADHTNKLCVFVSKRAFEILPLTGWNKGSAVKWINAQLGISAHSSIYIGDDTTDEDAFSVLTEGVTVKVGEDYGETRALYMLNHPREVLEFLEWLRLSQ